MKKIPIPVRHIGLSLYIRKKYNKMLVIGTVMANQTAVISIIVY